MIESSDRRRSYARFHADRAARRDRHHRRPDRAAAARRAVRSRGRPSGPVHQQPEAARPGQRQLRVGQRRLPDRHLHDDPDQWGGTSGRSVLDPVQRPSRGTASSSACSRTTSRPRSTTRSIRASITTRRRTRRSPVTGVASIWCPSDPSVSQLWTGDDGCGHAVHQLQGERRHLVHPGPLSRTPPASAMHIRHPDRPGQRDLQFLQPHDDRVDHRRHQQYHAHRRVRLGQDQPRRAGLLGDGGPRGTMPTRCSRRSTR